MATVEEAQVESAASAAAESELPDILSALQRLDHLLERAVIAATAAYGAESAADRFRGLHISPDEVERLLARAPGAPLLWAEPYSQNAEAEQTRGDPRLAWLAQVFTLSPFDIDVILMALAPEIDLRYERLYAFLQDDVSKKRPTVDLVLNLLCPSAEARLAERARFAPEAPLVRNRLICLIPDTHQTQPPLLAHHLKLDEQIVRLLLEQPGIDPRLQSFAKLVQPELGLEEIALDNGTKQALRGLVTHARETREPLRLYFHGPVGVGKRRCAEALAYELAAPLLVADLGRIVATETDFGETIKLLFRESWFQDAILYLDGVDALRGEARSMAFDCVLDALAEGSGITILAGATPWRDPNHRPVDVITVPFRLPDFASRRIEWQTSLAAKGVSADERTLHALGDRFRLTPAQIGDAVSTACGYAQWRAASAPSALARSVAGGTSTPVIPYMDGTESSAMEGIPLASATATENFPSLSTREASASTSPMPSFRSGIDRNPEAGMPSVALDTGHSLAGMTTYEDNPPLMDDGGEGARVSVQTSPCPTPNDLFAAARAQSGHDVAALAHKIEPKYVWEDIVLPEDSSAQLREICQRVAHRHRVLGEWGFDRKLSLGKGVNALFAGPSGTGKTMAAEIIANALGLDLYRIDLAGVVSKYIGETEKNLDRVFSAAENANAILFFDEADALFGKRSEVRDSHDRYANIEISYLLQKMEEYDGIAILATNLRQNLDDAFMRRLAFTVYFPFPDEASRRQIWTGIWPAETPLDADIDLDFLARQFKLSGGNIKNIALASAFLAAEEESPVAMAHLFQATRREHQKMGKTLSEPEFDGVRQEPREIARLAR